MTRSPLSPPRRRAHDLARHVAPPAFVGLVAAVPVAVWWLVGDQSTVPPTADPDYYIRPLAVGSAVEQAAGIGSVVLAVGCAGVVAWCTAVRMLDPRWWSVLVPLLAAGSIAGSGWRVLTAGVIGTNFGAGIVIVLGAPVVAMLLAWALFRSLYLAEHRATRRRADR